MTTTTTNMVKKTATTLTATLYRHDYNIVNTVSYTYIIVACMHVACLITLYFDDRVVSSFMPTLYVTALVSMNATSACMGKLSDVFSVANPICIRPISCVTLNYNLYSSTQTPCASQQGIIPRRRGPPFNSVLFSLIIRQNMWCNSTRMYQGFDSLDRTYRHQRSTVTKIQSIRYMHLDQHDDVFSDMKVQHINIII